MCSVVPPDFSPSSVHTSQLPLLSLCTPGTRNCSSCHLSLTHNAWKPTSSLFNPSISAKTYLPRTPRPPLTQGSLHCHQHRLPFPSLLSAHHHYHLSCPPVFPANCEPQNNKGLSTLFISAPPASGMGPHSMPLQKCWVKNKHEPVPGVPMHLSLPAVFRTRSKAHSKG